MNDRQLLQSVLERTARRRRWDRARHGLVRGLLIGACVWLVAVAAYKLLPLPVWTLWVGASLGGAAVVVGFLLGFGRRMSLAQTAGWIDARAKLQERLSTALEIAAAPSSSSWNELLLNDAATHARQLDPQKLSPWRWPALARWALLILAVGVGLGFVPAYRSAAHQQKQATAARIREVGRELNALTKQQLAARPPALEPTQKALENVEQLGAQLAKVSLTRAEALRELASATDKLNQDAAKLSQNPALRRMERAAREPGGAGGPSPAELQKQIDAAKEKLGHANAEKLDQLQKDLQKIQQNAAGLPGADSPEARAAQQKLAKDLADLAQQAADAGLPLNDLNDAIEALKSHRTDRAIEEMQAALNDLDKLRQLAKDLRNLQQQAARLGKDLPEQLKQGQVRAAQASLRRMIDQLQSDSLTPEQLRKLLEEISKSVDPAEPYGQAGEHLKNAAQKMRQGQKSAAAQDLAQAARELENLLQQLADAEALEAALEGLDRAQLAIASDMDWFEAGGT